LFPVIPQALSLFIYNQKGVMVLTNKRTYAASNGGEDMKKLILAGLLLSIWLSAQAQLFSPESTSGALLGGLAGGIIGNNHGHHTGEGIAIGAASGFLLGSIAHEANRNRYYGGGYYGGYYPSFSYYSSYYRPYYGYGWGQRGWRGGAGFSLSLTPDYYYAGPAYYSAPSYYAPSPVPVVERQQPAPVQPAPAPQPVAASPNKPVTPMSGANSLFGR
jgi:hypothetical protein